jgi:galactokinase
VRDSGNSSWKWLQNVYVPARCQEEQSLSVGLALTEIFIEKHGLEERAACRVHGGGFAGVIQVFLPDEAVDSYTTWMLSALGKSPDPKENPVHVMGIRPYGALEL